MSFVSLSTRPSRYILLLAAVVGHGLQRPAFSQEVSVSSAKLTDVVEKIEAATPYRFLYRDALVSGVRVTMDARGNEVLTSLGRALRDHGLRLQVDAERDLVFILPLSPAPEDGGQVVKGTVSDAMTLERLPHATLVWSGARGSRGAATDEGGRFLIRLDPAMERIILTVSFVGYTPDTLFLSRENLPRDLAIKLHPRLLLASEVVVSSPLISSNLDSTWHHLLGASLGSPVGEQSTTRALQILPAVGLTTAVSSGLNVRGSRTDGFQILLDGVPIYNPSHLFGMFDAFNPDALQAVDFYYGVAPARFQAPPGGTLSFLTRPGSKHDFRVHAGMTTATFSGTVEGPLAAGKGSWLLSARRSYLDTVDWFNNNKLVAIGLGVARENSGTRRVPVDERTLVAGVPSATFFDIHAKVEQESSRGATFQISAYLGGDRTLQTGERIIALNPQRQDPRIRSAVTSSDDWGNAALSVHYRSAVTPNGFSNTYAGFTRYHGSFRKDDFFYRLPTAGNGPPQLLFAPFLNDNSLAETRLAHESSVTLSPTLAGSMGFSAQRLVATYDELSALRQEYQTDQQAWQIDLFGELSEHFPGFSTTLGIRPQYFSAGNYLRWSPRITLVALTTDPASVSVGYTRNHQFVHHLYIENAAGSDVWVLSNTSEPPGAVDHLTASLLYRSDLFTLQLEAFLKWHKNLRRHETLRQTAGLPDGPVLLSPWTHDNRSRARGIEALLSHRFGPTTVTATYALSRVEISNPGVNAGSFFLADWDRPNQFAAYLHLQLLNSLSTALSMNIASGQPNPLADLYPSEPFRYPPYHRLDLSLRYQRSFATRRLTAFLRFYNFLNTQNVWYRTAETVLQGRGQNIHLAFEPVAVYDLGRQPTFGFSLDF